MSRCQPRRALALVLALATCGVASCRTDGGSARAVAEDFLDQHYVVMNLKKAKSYCSGLALRKVEEELHLVEGQVIDDSTRQPKVSYEFSEERPEGERRTTFVYTGKVKLDGGASFDMRWIVNTVRDEHGVWRVSNFKEFQ